MEKHLAKARDQGGDNNNRSPRLAESDHAVITIVDSPDVHMIGRVFTLQHERTSLGCWSCSDIYVVVAATTARNIGRGESMIRFRDGQFWVEDRGGSKNTRHNGYALDSKRHERGKLEAGDLIQIGGELDANGQLQGHASVKFVGKCS